MSLLLVSYVLNSALLVLLGGVFLKKYKNLGGVFFFIFSISTALWFLFFILSYSFTQNLILLESFIKISYFLSIITLYSFVLFLVFFTRSKGKIQLLPIVVFWIVALLLAYIYIYSPLIVSGLYFDTTLNDWYEVGGAYYLLHLGLSLLFVPLSIIFGIYRFKNVSPIDKKRLQYIFIGMLTFISLCFIFLLFLPLFGILKGQVDKYITFFFLPFIIGVFYSIRRYDFLNFRIAIMNIILFLYSFISAYFFLLILKIYSSYLHIDFQNYWGIKETSLFFDLSIGLIVFLGVFHYLQNHISYFLTDSVFDVGFEKMKKEIPFILNFRNLNKYLDKSFRDLFSIQGARIVLGNKGLNKTLISFFAKNTKVPYIVNDMVFIEENKKLLGNVGKKISKYSSETYLFFPLVDSDNIVRGVLEIGAKPLRDPFGTSELQALDYFTGFLSGHLKYIDIYKQIQDLTVSLDKRVDEKTIEFNNLLNKQKEFIAYVGHEIKNPVTNTLFLSDSLRESLKDSKDLDMREDANILYDELVKVSGLVKHIFSTEKFDLGKVELFLKKINLSEFLNDELEGFKHKFPYITFNANIGDNIFKEIDETQFRQVIQNLINNTVKFIPKINPIVSVTLKQVKKNIYIYIEDNGEGFTDIDISEVFGKYSTGGGSSSGLGMGLYLCQKIVELHGGKIEASNSDTLKGACFFIKL